MFCGTSNWVSWYRVDFMNCIEKIFLSKTIESNNFTNIASKGVMENKDFRNAVKPFLTSKGFLDNDYIAINFDKKTVTDYRKLFKIFNIYYISVVQNTIGTNDN